MKYLCLLLLSLPAFGQFGAASRILSGTGAPVAAQCTVENNVGLVWARKDGADVGTTFYVCGATGVGTYGWELRGGAPGGASALTTVGSVPFVTSAGVLGQNTNFRFFTGTGNLVVGTTTDDGTNRLQVAGSVAGNTTVAPSQADGAVALRLANNVAGNGVAGVAGAQITFAQRYADADPNVSIRVGGIRGWKTASNGAFGGGVQLLSQPNSSGDLFAVLSTFQTGNVAIGTTTDGGFKLDVASSGSSGTARIYDQTPTTGSTSLVVRAGAGQGGNNLTTWQSAAGATLAFITDGGRASFSGSVSIGSSALDTGLLNAGTGLKLGSGSLIGWNNAASVSTSNPDLSLSRASANTLQVGDGAANSNGTIIARIHTWANGTEGTCDATLRGQVVMVQGGAGVADTFRVCRKDAANAYAWTALY